MDGPGSELFDSQQHHLVEYCRALTGNEDDAASLAQSVLASSRSLLGDPARFRAWLFALARREALLANPGGATPADGDREILDLVHRYGIEPGDLAVVLGIPADEAAERLSAAEMRLSLLADGDTQHASPAGADDAAEPPPADLKAMLARPGRRLQLVVATAVAVAVIAWAVYFLGDFAQSVGSRGHAAQDSHRGPVAAPTVTPSPAATPSHRATPRPSVTVILGNQSVVLPVTSPTTGPAPAPAPTPIPSGTRTTPPPTSPPPTTPPPTTAPPTTPPPTPSPSAS